MASACWSFSAVVDDTPEMRVCIVGPTEVFGTDHFTGCCLDQRRTAEEDGALSLTMIDLSHGRHIGATSRTEPADHRAICGMPSLTGWPDEEDAASVLYQGKPHPALAGRARRNTPDRSTAAGSPARSPAPAVLLHCQRVMGTALHGGVVGIKPPCTDTLTQPMPAMTDLAAGTSPPLVTPYAASCEISRKVRDRAGRRRAHAAAVSVRDAFAAPFPARQRQSCRPWRKSSTTTFMAGALA